ncbi:MAG: hypothetical protein ACRDOE_10140 [Streptosporangiaceae bacterium]
MPSAPPPRRGRRPASYREAADLYLRPALGHVRLTDLRDHHFRDLAAAMRKINRPEADADGSDLLRRLLAAQAVRDGRRYSARPLTDARIKRVLAVASSWLADLVPHTLAVNPAAAVKVGKGRKVKPLLWTAARIGLWRGTGQIPGPVMVWSAAHCGGFLDSIEGDRLYALYHLAAYWGLRRSELCGLPPVRFHDLRHGSASMLLAAGQPLNVVSEIMGHATVAFTADVLR